MNPTLSRAPSNRKSTAGSVTALSFAKNAKTNRIVMAAPGRNVIRFPALKKTKHAPRYNADERTSANPTTFATAST